MKLSNLFLILLTACPAMAQDFLTLEDGAKLYIEEEGTGQALIFIPGWTMTHRFFENQKAFFSKGHHFISYDPRGQGKSDKTAHGNSYYTHAEDLHQILIEKDLDYVVLVGWSSGCLTVYAYLRRYGLDKIDKLVLIDEPPKWIGDVESEWVYGTFEDYRGSLEDLISQNSNPDGIIDWMLKEPVDNQNRKWMAEEIGMTPPHVALSLYVDGLICDYNQELIALPEHIPAFFMVRSSWFDQARSWLEINVPHAKVEEISSHAMFWENPEPFNHLLSNFLTDSKGHKTLKK